MRTTPKSLSVLAGYHGSYCELDQQGGGGGGEVRWPSLTLLFTLILPFCNDVRIARLWWLQLPLFLPSQSYFAFSSPARDALHCEIESQVGLILLP